jgi:ribosome-associated heat shock protein Hsp15
MNPPAQTVRLDRWLLAARCFKTRGLAQEACDGGHAKLNGRSAASSSAVKPGDVVEVRTHGGVRILEVAALDVKRGTATHAATLYHDRTPAPDPAAPEVPGVLRDAGAGRPTKRDGRLLRALRGW